MACRSRPRRRPQAGAVLALAVLALAARAQTPAGALPPLPHDPPLLLRVSFDATIDKADVAAGQSAFVPFLYDRSPLLQEKGIADWQRSKDYVAYRAAQDAEGRLGACLSVPVGKSHRFRALGNVSVRHGTIAFWVNFGRPLGEAHAPILAVTGTGYSLRVRYRTIHAQIGPVDALLKDRPWEPNRWYHLAAVYDCCQGAKLYVDGALHPASRWGKPEYGWTTDERYLDQLALGSDSYTGSGMPLRLDELNVYSVPLAAAEVARLARGEPASASPATEPPVATEAFGQHRRHELGWDLSGDYLSVGPGSAGELAVRQIGVVRARDVKCWRTGAVDGIPWTRWPTDYQGYELTNGGLHLGLEPDARIDYLRIRGDFRGWVYAGEAVGEPARDTALLALESPGRFLRQRLRQPAHVTGLSFFRVPPGKAAKMDELGRQPLLPATTISEVDFVQIGDLPAAIRQATAQDLYLTATPFVPADDWTRWTLQSQNESADRATLALATQPPPAPAALRLPALRQVHLMVPPSAEPVPMAGVRLLLAAQGLAGPTRLRLQVVNPIDITRTLVDMDLRLDPGAGAPREPFRILLDLQDVIIPAGQALWLRLVPEHDLVLDLTATRVLLLTRPQAEVLTEHVRNLLGYARDRFIHVSEPRPWGHVPLTRCGERQRAFRQLDVSLTDLKRNAPDDENLFGLWTWTHPAEPPDLRQLTPPAAAGAPTWALYAKECLKKYRAFALWWIENRQIDNGLFGSHYGDDSDLVNDWLSLGLICDPDGRIRDSVRRLGDYCWLGGPILHGINRVHTDALHAYEEGINVQPHEAQLHYGNPVYLERLMETTRTVRDELTYPLPGGRRFFKAWWYGATRVDTENERGRDMLTNALMLHPALYLAYYSRNDGAVRLLTEWAGTWCELQTRAWQAATAKRSLPVAVRYPTGEVVQTTAKYVSGYGFLDTCLGAFDLTGKDTYFTPIRSWLENGDFAQATATDWLHRRDPAPYAARIRELAEGIDWGPLRPEMGDDSRSTLGYLAWQVTGERRFVEAALRKEWERITILFPMHTWAEQSADRVAVSKTLVDRLYLGGTPGFRNKLWPTHTVSWEGLSEEFAAWVLETTPTALRIWVYNFEPKPQSARLRVWGLEPGTYDVRIGPDADQDTALDAPAQSRVLDLARNVPVPITLPSRQLMLVEIAQRTRGQPQWPRPDLAVTATAMTYAADTGTLSFVVHNVGSAAAVDVTVAVEADGRRVAEHRVPRLDAPADLEPRTVTFTQTGLRPARRVTVTVDPDQRLAELCEENNTAEFDVRGAH